MAEAPKAKILKSMPKITKTTDKVAPVYYWGGVIYTCAKLQKFRLLKERGNAYNEKSSSFLSRPQKDAWKECVQAIEQHHKK